ncbi:hypothetical protein QE380_000173 [Acinetobacter baylyi]|uniref:Uncharacterized protein n=1 Tax=Acinetobacter baylyi TaxID=202950 RepID=A0ABU0URS7_ACIBI|nr:hypothetical protein [Acinetobacter baylyi]MDQ1207250.1 hypothetical protein [Acinetobacter baylyi]MDR6105669.1 hypothetical protein [Acinetobacter baylyi]MDR6187611.1 hypothetical protein [Acinetobacter baylyi]
MFKVGDKVVLIAGEDKRIFKVDFAGWDTNLSVTGLGKYKDIRGYVWDKKLFRLATPEEIAAGHRIDKCEVLHMVDVSPRCEVRNG